MNELLKGFFETQKQIENTYDPSIEILEMISIVSFLIIAISIAISTVFTWIIAIVFLGIGTYSLANLKKTTERKKEKESELIKWYDESLSQTRRQLGLS